MKENLTHHFVAALVKDRCNGCIFENKKFGEFVPEVQSRCQDWSCLSMSNGGVPMIVVKKPEAHARRTDPDTSHAAAATVKVASIKDHIMIDLSVHGGQTGKELSARSGIPLNSITPRFKQLVNAGKIKDSGERRDRQIVWVLA